MKAIDTIYKGYKFRSRLEARWAVVFDVLEINWVYEPEGYDLEELGRYLPDFFLRFSRYFKEHQKWPDPGHFVEIKPIKPNPSQIAKLTAVENLTHHRSFFLIGVPGEHHVLNSKGELTCTYFNPCGEEIDESIPSLSFFALRLANHFSPDGPTITFDDVEYAIQKARQMRFEK